MVCPLIVVRQGDKYGPEYVERLKTQAFETSGMETLVLGDGDDADIQLIHGYKGWDAKFELLRPDVPKPFVYVDLDSYILEDISYMSRLNGNWISREWWRGMTGVQSSVMRIEYASDMWRHLKQNEDIFIQHKLGDQAFFKHFDWNYFDTPREVGSYKLHNKEKPVSYICTFHGKPKMQHAGGWAQDMWNA